MKTIEQTRRELFEAWASRERWVNCSPCRDELFDAFNAALDAVEIELPSPDNYSDDEACSAVSECRAAIEQTGLGIRIK